MRSVVVTGFLLSSLVLTGCLKTAKEDALARGAKVVTKAQLEKLIPGNTMSGKLKVTGSEVAYSVLFSTDGRTSGIAMGDRDLGRYRVQGDTLCIKWSRWQGAQESCATYYDDKGEYKVFMPEGALASTAKLEQGNPKHLKLDSDRDTALAAKAITPLTAADAKAELTGNTLSGHLEALDDAAYHAFYAPDGKVVAKVSGMVSDEDKGAWHVKDGGEVCLKWTKWNGGSETCGPLYRHGAKLESFTPEGMLAVVAQARKGNPEKLEP